MRRLRCDLQWSLIEASSRRLPQGSGLWCNSSIFAREANGPGANPGFLTKFIQGRAALPRGLNVWDEQQLVPTTNLNQQQPIQQSAETVLWMSWFNRGSNPHLADDQTKVGNGSNPMNGSRQADQRASATRERPCENFFREIFPLLDGGFLPRAWQFLWRRSLSATR